MKNHTNEPSFDDCPETCVPEPGEIARFHAAIRAVVGKWKIEILCLLLDGPLRFGELRQKLPGVTQHMLTAQLRELAVHGLVTRTAYAEIPPRVEYTLTEAAIGLLPVFRALKDWSEKYGTRLIERDKSLIKF